VCILDPKALGSTIEDLKPAALAAGGVVAPAVAAQLLMDRMKLDGFYRRIDSQVQAVPPPANESTAADTAAGVVDTAETGIDLIELGADFFIEIVSSIGELF
jgi:hypothetical protein